MLTLLFWVIILGVIAWGVMRIPMAEPFRTVAIVIIVIIAVIVLFRALQSANLNLNLGFNHETDTTRITQNVCSDSICSRSIA